MLNLKTLRPRFLGGRGRRKRVRGLFKEFKEFFFLSCNHLINFNIVYFLLRERAMPLLPLQTP
jgi:hypothetical protein